MIFVIYTQYIWSFIAACIKSTVTMLLYFFASIIGITIFHSFVKDIIKIFQWFFLNTLFLSIICFRNIFLMVNYMIKFTTISEFNFDSSYVKPAIFLFWIKECIFIINIHKIDMDILIYSIFWFFIIRFKLFFNLFSILGLFVWVFRYIFLIFLTIWLLGINSFHNIIVNKVKKIDFLLSIQLNTFHFNHFTFIFSQTYVNDTSSCVKKTYNCFSQVEFYRLIF